MKLWNIALIAGMGLVVIGGCGTKRPDGIPPLRPAKVTVNNGGTPIANATVSFIYQGSFSGSWAVNGVTNANGIAEIMTSQGEWRGKGAPEGEYIVYITRMPDYEADPIPDAIKDNSDALEIFFQEQMRKRSAAPQVIPEILSNPARTPLRVEVTAGGKAELAVDVSEHQ